MPENLITLERVLNVLALDLVVNEAVALYHVAKGTKTLFERDIEKQINQAGRHQCGQNGLADTIPGPDGKPVDQKELLKQQFVDKYLKSQNAQEKVWHSPFQTLTMLLDLAIKPVNYARSIFAQPQQPVIDTRRGVTPSLTYLFLSGRVTYRHDSVTFKNIGDEVFGKKIIIDNSNPKKPKIEKYAKGEVHKDYVGKPKFNFTSLVCGDNKPGPGGGQPAPIIAQSPATIPVSPPVAQPAAVVDPEADETILASQITPDPTITNPNQSTSLAFPITLAQATAKPWYDTYIFNPANSIIDSVLRYSGTPVSTAVTGQLSSSPATVAAPVRSFISRPAFVN